MKTAEINRSHIFGTRRFELRVLCRGAMLRYTVEGYTRYASLLDDSSTDVINICKAYAKVNGFTHVRFTGDWDKRTKPKNGKV